MKDNSLFVLPFAGIKLGVHQYNFTVTEMFFEDLSHLQLENGLFKVELELEKKETMMLASFKAKGTAQQPCRRCNDLVDVFLNTNLSLVYKFGSEESEDENLIVLHPDSFEINVYQPIYEMIAMALSSLSTHEEGGCNQEMLAFLNAHKSNLSEQDTTEDSIWSKLKNLN